MGNRNQPAPQVLTTDGTHIYSSTSAAGSGATNEAAAPIGNDPRGTPAVGVFGKHGEAQAPGQPATGLDVGPKVGVAGSDTRLQATAGAGFDLAPGDIPAGGDAYPQQAPSEMGRGAPEQPIRHEHGEGKGPGGREGSTAGFADSKTLTEEKRERLFAAIQAEPRLSSGADCLLAALISGRMLAANKTSLNALAMGSTCALIQRALEAGVNLAEVYVDTVGDAGKHRDALAQRFPGIAFIVCPKADAIYPIV
eukprot:scaffold3.g6771.t1